MELYKLRNENELIHIRENYFKLEKEMQTLTEKNLDKVFGLTLVKTEFSLNNFRIDSLAFDDEINAFVIIEYKKDKNFSVIDQGYAYLSLMLNNKADFILEYNETQNNNLKKDDVDWSQSRVLFISPSFTRYQKESINFKDLPIELWEIKKFGSNIISFSQVTTASSQESVKTISRKDEKIEKVSREIKVYTEEEHINRGTDGSVELYEKLKSSILNLENVTIKPKKKYIAFVGASNIIDVRIQKNAIKIWFNLKKGQLDDPKKIARDVSNVGHWGNGDYEIRFWNDDNFEYILSLIKQAYLKNKK
jgi:predicted transport protein